jgi:hypothetical protein
MKVYLLAKKKYIAKGHKNYSEEYSVYGEVRGGQPCYTVFSNEESAIKYREENKYPQSIEVIEANLI